ncbi:hypothetical protein [Thiomicrospira sp. ALE5]|uniref:hypothetical protein n=1 Tax=Thiomicrospira sp. ALE5 TaxID=748650 RepID=UPI0008E1C539|nr:hypothetical protein [Thiomicrospira sp. ALE5]SFR61280.1 hypothetical protein SAMN03092900_1734 [Thiomicrospira sp. ALE5]
MTMRINGHAKEVVARFKVMLDEQQLEMMGEEHFEELELLIDAAMEVVHSDAYHEFAKELEAIAKKMRKSSAHTS